MIGWLILGGMVAMWLSFELMQLKQIRGHERRVIAVNVIGLGGLLSAFGGLVVLIGMAILA